MFYKVKIDDEYKFIDERAKADYVAQGAKVDVLTGHKTLLDVVQRMSNEFSDGETLDEVIKLIDEGECYA